MRGHTNVAEPSGPTHGSHWRVLHVLEIRGRTFESEIWQDATNEMEHYSEAKQRAIKELRLTEADDLMLILQEYGPDWFYVIQVEADGEWHTVDSLDRAIGEMLAERHAKRELARKNSHA
jgi:hypothetical protein